MVLWRDIYRLISTFYILQYKLSSANYRVKMCQISCVAMSCCHSCPCGASERAVFNIFVFRGINGHPKQTALKSGLYRTTEHAQTLPSEEFKLYRHENFFEKNFSREFFRNFFLCSFCALSMPFYAFCIFLCLFYVFLCLLYVFLSLSVTKKAPYTVLFRKKIGQWKKVLMKEQHKYFITLSLYHVNNRRASKTLRSCLIFVFLLSALFLKRGYRIYTRTPLS